MFCCLSSPTFVHPDGVSEARGNGGSTAGEPELSQGDLEHDDLT